MTRILAPDGLLTLGASESLIGLKTDLVANTENRGIFMRAGAASAPADPATRYTPSAPAATLPPGFGATAMAATRLRTAG
jgi:chemotaxis protein methyltransferase CheR